MVNLLSYRLSQHFHPLSIKMLEIARAMEHLAGAGNTNSRTQIKKATALSNRGSANQTAHGVAVLRYTFFRVAGVPGITYRWIDTSGPISR